MHTEILKSQAKELRRKGLSINQISKKLNVAKSTASVWVRKINLPQIIKDKLVNSSENGLKKALKILQTKRELEKIENEKEVEKLLFELLPKSNPDFWKFCAALLFWCEGSKSLSYLRFTNSDPDLIKLFLHSLHKGFNIKKDRLRALVHLHDYHNEREELDFWSKTTKIPLSQFHKSYRKQHRGIRKRNNYHGCIAIGYADSSIAKKLSTLYHGFAKKI